MPRWVDLSEHGVAIRLRETAQGKQLVLQSLGSLPVTEDEAAALDFRRVDDEFVRDGSQIALGEVRKAYPQVKVRDFTDQELVVRDAPAVASDMADAAWAAHQPRAEQLVLDGTIPREKAPAYKQAWKQGYRGDAFPAEGVDDGVIDRAYQAGMRSHQYATGARADEASDAIEAEPAAPLPTVASSPASAVLRACSLSPVQFAREVTWLKMGGVWRAALDGHGLDIGAAGMMCPNKSKPDDKMVRAAQDELLRQSVAIDPTAGALPALCEHIKRAYPGPMTKGRQAEMNVMRLLAQLGVAERLMDSDAGHVRIKNPPYIDLVIERHAYNANQKMTQGSLILTHYREVYGDKVLDAEMVFGIAHGRLWLQETATQNPFTGGESRRLDRSFANMFSRNLLNQGFGKGVLDGGDVRPETDPAYVEPIDIVTGTESHHGMVQMRINSVRTEHGWRADWQLVPRNGPCFTHERTSFFDDPVYPTSQEAMDAGIADLGRRIADLKALSAFDIEACGVSMDNGYARCRAINAYRQLPEGPIDVTPGQVPVQDHAAEDNEHLTARP